MNAEEQIYQILRKHKLPLKKREEVLTDLLVLTEQLQKEVERLIQWKKESIEGIKNLDLQGISKVMDLEIGDDISINILPYIISQKKEVERLKGCRNVSLENWIRNKLSENEEMHDYAVATDTVRCWIDLYKPTKEPTEVKCESSRRNYLYNEENED